MLFCRERLISKFAAVVLDGGSKLGLVPGEYRRHFLHLFGLALKASALSSSLSARPVLLSESDRKRSEWCSENETNGSEREELVPF